MKYELKLADSVRDVIDGLDGIIEALGGTYPPPNPKTVVTYQGGIVEEYLIEGELGRNSIPNKENAVKVEIGTAVTSIGDAAFFDYSSLTSITIPDGITSIGPGAFVECSWLKSVTFDNKTIIQVQGMTNYSWYLEPGCVIHCTDGDITI